MTKITEPTRLPNGKWRHPLNCHDFDDETCCRTDYRFALDWQRTRDTGLGDD